MKNYCEAGATVHGIRHAFRDRLRAVEAPVDLIDQLGGWSAKSVGIGYGDGYDMRTAHHHISHICADMTSHMGSHSMLATVTKVAGPQVSYEVQVQAFRG